MAPRLDAPPAACYQIRRMEPGKGIDDGAALVPADEAGFRRRIIRDTLVFQLKLLVDGAKDVVLSPLAFTAGLIDLVIGPTERPLLHQVLRLGAAIGRWLNVYGDEPSAPGIDDHLRRLEAAYRERRKSGSTRLP